MRSSRARGLLLLLLLSGTGWEEVTLAEGEKPILRELRFVSNAPVDVRGLRELLPLRIGEPVGAEQLKEARGLLDRKGIFDTVSLDTVATDDGVEVVVRLERKKILRHVDVRGYESLRRREIWRLVRIRQEMIFDDDAVEADRQRLLRRYKRIGFSGTEVVVEVSAASRGEVDLRFEIHEGVPQTITDITLAGDVPVSLRLPKAVRDLVGERHTREGQRGANRAVLRELRDAGYYEADVRSTWEAGVLHLAVDAGPRFEFEIVGNRTKSKKSLLQMKDLRDRLLITDGTWRELARRMRHAYQESGYYEARVDVEIEEGPVKRVIFRIDEGTRFSIRSIVFEGNGEITGDTLLGSIETRPRRWFPWPRKGALVDETLEEDTARLVDLYRAHGFESARVPEARRVLDADRGSIDLTFVIEEGPGSTVREVAMDGMPDLEADLELELRPGIPFTAQALRLDRQTILRTLQAAGYPQVQVESTTLRSRQSESQIAVTVGWVVDSSPRQRIGDVVVAGNIDTRDAAIVRALDLDSGDPMDTYALLDAQARVYRLGIFRRVSVRPVGPEESSERDVVATVTERPPGSFRWGGGYNTRDGFGTFLELGFNNFRGMARRLTLHGEMTLKTNSAQPDQYRASLGYLHPDLADTDWRLHASLRGERNTQSVQPFNLRSVGGAIGVSRALGVQLEGGVDLQTEFLDLFDVKNDVVLTGLDEGSSHSVALTPFLIHDGRNDPSVPTSGSLQSVRVRYALPGLSSAQVVKVSLQHTRYVSLPFELVFSYAGRVGWARAVTGVSQVPLADRFFLGGQTTVRGFKENSIGPEGDEGNRVGGDLALNLNLELQVPLVFGFGAAFFLDGGGLYLVGCDTVCRTNHGISDAAFTFENFRRAAGAGLRYRTPVGPIRLDYGIKLDRRSGESFGRFHFGIGLAF